MRTLGAIAGEGFSSVIEEDDDGRVFFTADADIDADGANGQNDETPAYKADNTGSEHLANGGMAIKDGKVICAEPWSRNIVILGNDNQPKIFPGGIIASKTWYKHPDKAASDPAAYVDSETVPYVVVPPLIIQETEGVVRGCKARVTFNEQSVDCVVADKGPVKKIGEISIAAARKLGINPSPRNGGREKPDVIYELWPGVPADGYVLKPANGSPVTDLSAALTGIERFYKVTANALNVRKEPSSSGAVINWLTLGERVEVTDRSEDLYWFKIKKEGKAGWVAHKFLEPNALATEEFPWMPIAAGEIGVMEKGEEGENPRILAYLASTTLDTSAAERNRDETPWCSAFVNWCVEKANFEGTDRAAASSWLSWGKKADKPRRGCITVFKRSGGNHVAFYISEDETTIKVLGGNQSNSVMIKDYPKKDLLGYRLPG